MEPQDRHAELAARNAARRGQVDALLDGLTRQSAALATAQAQAAAVTGRATSADGLVTVTVNAAGVVTDIRFAPSAFTRRTPDALARDVIAATRQAAADARRQVDAALAPVREDLPDLPEVFPGSPSLPDLVPKDRTPAPPARRPGRHALGEARAADRSAEDRSAADFGDTVVLRGVHR